jgi:hypothetical protein
VVVPPQNRLNTQQTPNPPAQAPTELPPLALENIKLANKKTLQNKAIKLTNIYNVRLAVAFLIYR